MAEKARTVPGARGRGPKPKLEHPMQTLGRVLGFVGKKYWLHLIVVVIAIVVSVLSMVQGTLFTKTLIDSYILPLVKTVQAGGTADFSGLIHAITRVGPLLRLRRAGQPAPGPGDDLCHPGGPAGPAQ